MKLKFSIFILSILFIFLVGCESKNIDSIEREKILAGFIQSQLSNVPTTSVSCSGSEKFADLSAAGFTNKCISCHSGSNVKGSVDLTSYTSVLVKVQKNQPESSALYKTITSGSMSAYSDATINNKVYCWIKNGAL